MREIATLTMAVEGIKSPSLGFKDPVAFLVEGSSNVHWQDQTEKYRFSMISKFINFFHCFRSQIYY